MNDKLNIGLNGHIKVISSKDNSILFEEHNQIESTALEIITRCLSQVDFNKSVDKIKAYGNFTAIEREIFFVQYNPAENSMLFRATFFEFDFDGTIDKLELRCSALNKMFASKDNLSILKDSQSRVQVDWKISVTSC